MGTGRTGRFYSKAGSAKHASKFALVHSTEGTFVKTMLRGQKNADGTQKHQMRLASGGHSQENIKLLDKYGIKYNIVKTYPNGVRVGNVPNHRQNLKKTGIGQSWFPKSWSEKDIKHAGEHVASLKCNAHAKVGETMIGVWKGVQVGVKKTNGKIATIFPTSNQPAKLWRKKK